MNSDFPTQDILFHFLCFHLGKKDFQIDSIKKAAEQFFIFCHRLGFWQPSRLSGPFTNLSIMDSSLGLKASAERIHGLEPWPTGSYTCALTTDPWYRFKGAVNKNPHHDKKSKQCYSEFREFICTFCHFKQ